MMRAALPALAAALLSGAGFLALAGERPRTRLPDPPAPAAAPALDWFPRPAAFAPEAAARLFGGPPAGPAAEAPVAEVARESPETGPRLLGTFLSGPRRSALIRFAETERPRWLGLGDPVGPGKIVAIEAGRVMLSDARVLALKRPAGAEKTQ